MKKGSIAIDFDGVIHAYTKGWNGGEVYDVPVTSVFLAIKHLMDAGYSVFVFSTRKPTQIKKWLLDNTMISEYEKHGMGNDPEKWVEPRYGFTCKIIPFWVKFWNQKNVLGITRRKLPALVYVDDRALKFEGDWMTTINQIKAFKTYQNG